VLVVLGHVLRGLTSSHLLAKTPAVQFMDMWIYSFHMPLFFFLSGLFLFRSATKSSLQDFASDKIRTVAYPYLVWSIVTVLLKAPLGEIPNTPRPLSDLLIIPTTPIEQYWFLYTLFVLVLFFGAMFAVGLKPWLAVALALLAHPSLIPISPSWSVLLEARTFAIYVALGAFLGLNYFGNDFNLAMLTLTSITGLALPALVIGLGHNQGLDIALALSGTAGVIATSLLLQRFNAALFIGFLGRHALEIYVAHTIGSAAARIMLGVFHVRSIEIHIIVGVAAGLCLPLAIMFVFDAIGFRYGFIFPKRKATTPGDKISETS
jgi:fucose 4-O-acetylase-like acetyltransferase